MESKAIINIVASECHPEEEERFNKWYNEVHVPLLFKYKGMKRVTRCRRFDENKERPKYLALYEFESKEAMDTFENSPERAAAMEEMEETWKDEGLEIKWVAPYKLIKTWER
jgi:uncharacterized protein (TIGR02118 family)